MALIEQLAAGDWVIAGSVALFGLAVYLLVRGLYPESILREMRQRKEARAAERERAAAGQSTPGSTPPPSPLRAFGAGLVERLGSYNIPLVKPKWRSRMELRFLAMGRPEYRPQDFIAQQELYSALFGVLGLMMMNLLGRPLWYAVPFFVFGFFFPYIWLSDQIKRRQRAISRALPYHIDLLTLSVEAGLDFGGALQTVIDKGREGPLLEELTIMIGEMKLGKGRSEALRNMADRVQMLELSTFVSNLVQADKMGTSLGKVLRIQSEQLRMARAQRAERLANEAPVKMLLPLVLCFFPTVFMILFGPILYRLMYGS